MSDVKKDPVEKPNNVSIVGPDSLHRQDVLGMPGSDFSSPGAFPVEGPSPRNYESSEEGYEDSTAHGTPEAFLVPEASLVRSTSADYVQASAVTSASEVPVVPETVTEGVLLISQRKVLLCMAAACLVIVLLVVALSVSLVAVKGGSGNPVQDGVVEPTTTPTSAPAGKGRTTAPSAEPTRWDGPGPGPFQPGGPPWAGGDGPE
jgi:hypothetical protein